MKINSLTRHLFSIGIIMMVSVTLHFYFFRSKSAYISVGTDASLQFLFFKYFLHHLFHEGHFFWSWSYGLGGDIYGQFSYYYTGSLFFWLSMLFPVESLQDVLNSSLFFSLARTFLAMFCMYLLMQYHKRSLLASITAAICYGGTAYFAFYSLFFDYMAEGFTWLPLLILGYDYLVDRRKSGLFVFAVVLVIVSNFYFGFISSVFLNIYAIFRYFTLGHPFSFKRFLHHYLSMVTYYFFGLLISSFMFLPAVYAFVHTNRFFRDVKIPLFFSMEQYKALFKNIIFPLEFSANDFLALTLVLPLGLFFFILLGFTAKEWKAHKSLFLFMLLLFLLPFSYSLFNGLSVMQYRWLYLFQFTVAYVTAFFIDSLFVKPLKKSQIVLVLLIILCFLILIKEKYEMYQEYVNVRDVFRVFVVLCIGVTILFKNYIHKNLLFPLLFIAISLNAVLNTYRMYSLNLGAYATREQYNEIYFSQSSFENKKDKELVQFIQKEDPGFYRILWGGQKLEYNSPMYYGYKGFSGYNSLISKNVQQFFMDKYNTLQIDAPSFFRDVDNRIYLETSLSNKYYVVLKPESFVPYGYVKVWETEKYGVYRNSLYLPPGFIYTNGVSTSEFSKLNTPEKDQLFLHAVVVDDPKKFGLSLFNTNSLQVKTLYSGTNRIQARNIQRKNNVFVAGEKGVITIPLERPSGPGEVLVEVTIKNPGDKGFEMKVEGKSFLKQPAEYIYSYPKQTFTFNLGDLKKNVIEISLSPGSYQIDNIQMFFNSYAPYPTLVENLKKDSMYNISYTEESMKGEVNCEGKGLLFLSVPFSPGWKVKVDGLRVKPEEVNQTFIGIPITKGHHTIELNYVTPMFLPGLAISILAFIGYLLFVHHLNNKISFVGGFRFSLIHPEGQK